MPMSWAFSRREVDRPGVMSRSNSALKTSSRTRRFVWGFVVSGTNRTYVVSFANATTFAEFVRASFGGQLDRIGFDPWAYRQRSTRGVGLPRMARSNGGERHETRCVRERTAGMP